MLLAGAIANDSGLTRLTMAGIPWVVQPGVIASAGDVRVEAGEVFCWVDTESIQQACKFKEIKLPNFLISPHEIWIV